MEEMWIVTKYIQIIYSNYISTFNLSPPDYSDRKIFPFSWRNGFLS